MRIVAVTDERGAIVEPEWLARAESVHRQLRPLLPTDYRSKMERVFARGGRMCAAVEADRVLGVAVYRISENTFAGVNLYVDDLVTDEGERSKGVGRALLEHLQQLARAAGCETFCLDSGVQRARAHGFYFREGMHITAFNFKKPLE
jgi:GNAT superfamily N-acetyltransferase